MQTYLDRVKELRDRHRSDVVLLLRPLMSDMPQPMHYFDDPFFPFSKAIIGATRDVVCGYLFDFAAYLVHGAAGAVALERSIAYTGSDALKVLHGPFTGTRYVDVVYEGSFGADAATVVSHEDFAEFSSNPNHGAYIVSTDGADGQQSVCDLEAGLLAHRGGLKLRIAGQGVLYGGYGEDFAQVCRASIEAMR